MCTILRTLHQPSKSNSSGFLMILSHSLTQRVVLYSLFHSQLWGICFKLPPIQLVASHTTVAATAPANHVNVIQKLKIELSVLSYSSCSSTNSTVWLFVRVALITVYIPFSCSKNNDNSNHRPSSNDPVTQRNKRKNAMSRATGICFGMLVSPHRWNLTTHELHNRVSFQNISHLSSSMPDLRSTTLGEVTLLSAKTLASPRVSGWELEVKKRMA